MIAGNWKMNTSVSEGVALFRTIRDTLSEEAVAAVEVVCCPPFTHVPTLATEAAGSSVMLGAQNMYFEDKGAYTGEISPGMLADVCTYVIIGHSERRQFFNESDEIVALKVAKAIKTGLRPIICVGESLDIRNAGSYVPHVVAQVKAALSKCSVASADALVFAYEPIWAIGTGLAASAGKAQEVIYAIRQTLGACVGDAYAQDIRILYGGSSTDENIGRFMAESDIDGALVGGASLKADTFTAMVRIAAEARG